MKYPFKGSLKRTPQKEALNPKPLKEPLKGASKDPQKNPYKITGSGVSAEALRAWC